MRNNNEKTRNFTIGNCNIKFAKVTSEYAIIEVTGKELGFLTMFKVTTETCKKIADTIIMSECINPEIKTVTIDNVWTKHRTYTKNVEESDFTYKYYECKTSVLTIISVGGHCLLTLSGDDENYRTISFNTAEYIKCFNSLCNYYKFLKGENRMNEW